MKILVAMSGGVDSSVAALLLKNDGHEVAGITMMLGFTASDGSIVKIGETAASDAAAVCEHIGIPHFVEDCVPVFGNSVINNFLTEYESGRTPNPCVRCNRDLKFGMLIEKMKELGYEKLATGHYAGIGTFNQSLCIIKNIDPSKDQSYFLYAIRRESLHNIIFPLNNLTKPEIRCIAEKANLPVAAKKESQDICFIKEDYRDFISERMAHKPKPGLFIDSKGKKLGIHKGIPYYTIGQRRGLGVSAPAPLYVVSFNLERNEIVLGYREETTAHGLIAHDLNLFINPLPEPLSAKIRYAQKETPCVVTVYGDEMKVMFETPLDSVTPGQSVVLYHNNIVAGGGIIDSIIS